MADTWISDGTSRKYRMILSHREQKTLVPTVECILLGRFFKDQNIFRLLGLDLNNKSKHSGAIGFIKLSIPKWPASWRQVLRNSWLWYANCFGIPRPMKPVVPEQSVSWSQAFRNNRLHELKCSKVTHFMKRSPPEQLAFICQLLPNTRPMKPIVPEQSASWSQVLENLAS